ncbi:hypothetical protein Y032_0094g2762 [Ancylostoma ceylanicum]|uniref:Uncharacterized protein n=1 Tax=Ancylostoma ceylanicum TaxID=53326 RepID=A0A016TL88_9BILA|nr:hypothetical protein Y032_0094g2762 [Ancylostoma ceylanicum]
MDGLSRSNPTLAWEQNRHGSIYGLGSRAKRSNTDGPGLATGQGDPPMPATRTCRLPGATHHAPLFRHCCSAEKDKLVFADVLIHSYMGHSCCETSEAMSYP